MVPRNLVIFNWILIGGMLLLTIILLVVCVAVGYRIGVITVISG